MSVFVHTEMFDTKNKVIKCLLELNIHEVRVSLCLSVCRNNEHDTVSKPHNNPLQTR